MKAKTLPQLQRWCQKIISFTRAKILIYVELTCMLPVSDEIFFTKLHIRFGPSHWSTKRLPSGKSEKMLGMVHLSLIHVKPLLERSIEQADRKKTPTLVNALWVHCKAVFQQTGSFTMFVPVRNNAFVPLYKMPNVVLKKENWISWDWLYVEMKDS